MIIEESETAMTITRLRIGDTRLQLRTNMVMAAAGEDGCWSFTPPREGIGSIVLEVPLGDAVSFWHPYAHWNRTTLPPDWMGRATTSLIKSTPMGCLYAHDGQTILGYAIDEAERQVELRFGVSEESKSFVIYVDLVATPAERRVQLRLIAGGAADQTISMLTAWLDRSVAQPAMATSPTARRPVYSTWYAYHHEINQPVLEAEAAIAADLGFGSLFVDFGWQRRSVGRRFEGCGDWQPDPTKFPDFGGFIDRIHARGLAVVAWVAPFLLGRRSDAYPRLQQFAPHHNPVLDASILDPRFEEVRGHLVETLATLVTTYNLDGLKIDFLETAMSYCNTPSGGDVDDVGTATRLMLQSLRDRLAQAGRPDPLIELRQPYLSPALTPYANVVRAEDCPGDAIHNRTAILDARLATSMTVHSDMMMWHPDLPVEAIARHLHSSLFAVPQISVPLAAASPQQIAGIRAWLQLWTRLSPTLLDGTLHAERPHANYPVVWAEDPDGSLAVVAVYEPNTVLELPDAAETVVVNATAQTHLWLEMTDDQPLRVTGFDVHGAVTSLDDSIHGQGLHRLPTSESGHLRLTRDLAPPHRTDV